jgi:hypothetical protein
MNRRNFFRKAAAGIALAALAPELIGTPTNPAPISVGNLQQIIFADFSRFVLESWGGMELDITYEPMQWDGVKQFRDFTE